MDGKPVGPPIAATRRQRSRSITRVAGKGGSGESRTGHCRVRAFPASAATKSSTLEGGQIRAQTVQPRKEWLRR